MLKSEDLTYAPAPRPPLWRRIWNSILKWWWAYLILAAVLFVAVLLIIFYAIIPKIGQSEIGAASISIDSIRVWDTKPNSLSMFIGATLHTKSIFRPTIEPFEVSLYLPDSAPDIRPFAKMNIGEMVARDGLEIVLEDNIEILDQEQFEELVSRIFILEELEIGVRGRPTIALGKLPKFKVDFDKVAIAKGLNSITGYGVKRVSLLLDRPPGGSNIAAVANVPFAAPITATIGTIIADVFTSGLHMGEVKVPPYTFQPGLNELPIEGNIDEVSFVRVLTTEHPDLILPVQVKLKSAYSEEGEFLPALTGALRRQSFDVMIDANLILQEAGLTINPLPGAGSGGRGGSNNGSANNNSVGNGGGGENGG